MNVLEPALAGRPLDRPLLAPRFAALAAEVEELPLETFLADLGRRARIYADLARSLRVDVLIVNDADEALTVYRSLLDDPAQAEAMGARARERVLDEHTYAHRARQLLSLVGLGVPAGARA